MNSHSGWIIPDAAAEGLPDARREPDERVRTGLFKRPTRRLRVVDEPAPEQVEIKPAAAACEGCDDLARQDAARTTQEVFAIADVASAGDAAAAV